MTSVHFLKHLKQSKERALNMKQRRCTVSGAKAHSRRICFGLFSVLCTLGTLFAVGCGSSPGSVGAACNPDAEASCNEGLRCSEVEEGRHLCAYEAGQTCDPDDGSLINGGCAADAECVDAPQASVSTGMGGAGSDMESVCVLTEGATCSRADDFCGPHLTCAETINEEYKCFGKVIFRGDVTDTSDDSAIPDAHIIALDEEGAAVTDIAVSDEAGLYELDVPVTRNEDGSPVNSLFTLNGSAQDYQPFPKGVRVALPINAGNAEQMAASQEMTDEEESENEPKTVYVVDNALTDIGLIPLEEAVRSSISGGIDAIDQKSNVAGLLVVATGEAGTFVATTDLSGDFTVFNTPDGSYEVTAYANGIQIGTETVTISGENEDGVVLPELEDGTTTVSGNISIVDAPGGSKTSVILVVADTFDENAARGEVPRGLRAPKTGPVSVTGDFSIEGVPAGRYVVLAAYENDGLVRDPDTNIAGTGFVYIDVEPGQETLTMSETFKVTEALATVEPGVDEPEAVDGKPTLEWADDSSEDWYEIRVFNAFGDLVWEPEDIPSVSGSETVSIQYEGPLDPGMYYQFRVSSWRQPGGQTAAPISTTEDLRGVFFLPAE